MMVILNITLWEQEVVGSNPATPTLIIKHLSVMVSAFLLSGLHIGLHSIRLLIRRISSSDYRS